MSPFEVLYGIKFHTPLSQSQSENRLIMGLDEFQEIEQVVQKYIQNIKTT